MRQHLIIGEFRRLVEQPNRFVVPSLVRSYMPLSRYPSYRLGARLIDRTLH